MRKKHLGIICLLSLGLVASIGAGVTYAAIYINESKTYSFDASTTDFSTFSIGHYFHGGDGTSTYPFLISNPTELRNLSKIQNAGFLTTAKYFKLANDFSWSGDDLTPIGTATYPFKGNFNGDGQCIHGMFVSSSSDYVGMFGVVNTATISGIKLSAPHITCSKGAASYAGFLCGRSTASSTVTNVYVYGGTSSLAIRATIKSTNASTTVNLVGSTAYLAGNASNLTVTTSGFINNMDSTSPSTTLKGGNPTSFSNATKTFYLGDSGIEIS